MATFRELLSATKNEIREVDSHPEVLLGSPMASEASL